MVDILKILLETPTGLVILLFASPSIALFFLMGFYWVKIKPKSAENYVSIQEYNVMLSAFRKELRAMNSVISDLRERIARLE